MNAGGIPSNEIVELLAQMPAWSDLPRGADAAQREEIEAIVRQIAEHDIADIAVAVGQFVVQATASPAGFDVSAMSKLYVLNRHLFAVPARTQLGSPRFASFAGVPVDGDQLEELWPWSIDGHGDLHLTGTFAGYAGESFQALREFEHFRDTYGLR